MIDVTTDCSEERRKNQVALANAGCCPFCTTSHPAYGPVDGTSMTQEASCGGCGARWEEGLATAWVLKVKEDNNDNR